jgi:hypothetical protein
LALYKDDEDSLRKAAKDLNNKKWIKVMLPAFKKRQKELSEGYMIHKK